MGTSNFHYNNCLYTVETAYTDEESGEEIQDEFIYEDTKENLSYEVDKIKNSTQVNDFDTDNEELSSFPSQVLTTLYIGEQQSLYFNEQEKEYKREYGSQSLFYIQIVLRSGYYEGLNIDYNIIEEYNTDFSTETLHNEECTPNKTTQKKLSSTIKKLEKIFSMFSTKTEVIAKFSNGETIYKTL